MSCEHAERCCEGCGRKRVVAAALSWLGTPYHHAARVKGGGVDCGQLLAAVYEDAGVEQRIPIEDYPPDWMMHRDEPRFMNILEQYARRVEPPGKPGDLVLFRWGRSPSHGGIVIEWPRIVHAYIKDRAVILSDIDTDANLAQRFVGVWSYWE